MHFCPEPGCGVLVQQGRCPTHAPRAQRSTPWEGLSHKWYRSRRWKALRLETIRRDPFCRTCRVAGQRVLSVDVDHITPHQGSASLFWEASNLQGLCRSCHSRKTASGS
jgi:5-methylcytosine-specific restriction protein A